MNTRLKNKMVGISLASTLCLAFASCATKSAALKQAHINYDSAANDPNIVRDAPVALHEAKKNIDKADSLSKSSGNADEVNHLAYLADKKIDIAKANANQQKYQKELSQVGQQRNDAILESRNREILAANQQIANVTVKANEAEAQALNSQAALEKSGIREANLAKELADLKAKETDTGTQLTLRDMMFEVGKSELTMGGVRDVNKIAMIAKQHPERDLVIEGHPDSRGTEASNQALSESRAKTVENLLSENGIPTQKMTVKGFGESYPISSNKSGTGRQLNRRVVVTILREGKQASDVEAGYKKM